MTGPAQTRVPFSAGYASQSRSERLIAAGRAVLASSCLLAVWLDPSQPARSLTVVHAALGGYFAYSLLVAAVAWLSPVIPTELPLFTQAIDMVAFPVLMYFTEGPGSPFYLYFLFALLCATLRWEWRGTLWSAGVLLATYLGMGLYASTVLHEPGFELNTFLIRGVFLAVVAGLLAWLGAHEQQLRSEMFRLASWPQDLPPDVAVLVSEALRHATDVLAAPRAVLVWEEGEEPWLHVASMSRGEVARSREVPGTWQPLVATPLGATDFLCNDVTAEEPMVVHSVGTELQRWQGRPLHAGFQERFGIRSVLSVRLRAPNVEGRLFLLDKPAMTSDDLVLGDIVARQVAARLDHVYLFERLREGAAAEERVRLARDLHDGLLQSLTGAALQLQAASGLLAREPKAARGRLQEVQRLIAGEQRDLRTFISGLKPGTHDAQSLAVRLEELARRVGFQWSIDVALEADGLQVPEALAHPVCFMVHEALVNAARHGRAAAVRVKLDTLDGRMRISVADNGRGFPFLGHYDHATLVRLERGPASLKERVVSLGGSLDIESAETGSRVEISIPLARQEA